VQKGKGIVTDLQVPVNIRYGFNSTMFFCKGVGPGRSAQTPAATPTSQAKRSGEQDQELDPVQKA